MNYLIIISAILIGLFLLLLIGIYMKIPWIVQEYPKEIEKQENKEFSKKIEEHKKGQN